jgi:chemotaxis protein methyltransferase CheR
LCCKNGTFQIRKENLRVEKPMMKMKDGREFTFLLDKIRRNRNLDFSEYRRPVLERRIQHRLYQTRCTTYWDYIMLLNREPGEYDRLMETLTIKVSGFFRDPRVFELLGNMIVPEIISRNQAGIVKKIRAWSCGSAFGQEAYSLAILFYEALGQRLNDFDIQILATDIDKNTLAEAQWGSYDRKALNKISPLLLFKYFTRTGNRYIVNDRVRSLVKFRYHDIVTGNTISGLDLVLCRNLLIYFQKELQEKILHKLHTALNPGGFLVIGNTESIPPPMRELFDVVSLRERIYRKNSQPAINREV